MTLKSIRARCHRSRQILGELVWLCAGWVLLWPVTLLIPRRTDLAVFHGRDGGKFVDNCKHLFACASALNAQRIAPVYLTSDRRLRDEIRRAHGWAEVRSSLRGMWLWLRAGTIVVDSVDWAQGVRFPASRGARIVQLWHGIPLKQVQLGRIRSRLPSRPTWERLLFKGYLGVSGRLARFEWFLSTSQFVTEHAFAGSFRYRAVSHAGYPRNDVLFAPGASLAELGTDQDALRQVRHHRATQRGPVSLYAPTFREALEDPFATNRIDLAALSRIAVRLDVLLLVKLHPWMYGRIQSVAPPGLIFVAPDSDAYPLMREVDFLITDYSSIFFDFLLLDRPVLFFPYDIDSYLSEERPMYFDYARVTPGPKCRTMAELALEMERLVAGVDAWQANRAQVRSLVFEHVDGNAAVRLLTELFPDAGFKTPLVLDDSAGTRGTAQ